MRVRQFCNGDSFMLPLTLLTLGILGQVGTVDVPTMKFTNKSGGKITLWIFCQQHQNYANDNKPLVVRAGATATLTLHEGYFNVIARNDYGQEKRNKRVLAARELDWMDL